MTLMEIQETIFRWRKFDGRPHWVHRTHRFAADSHGDWFIQKQGETSRRPGFSYVTESPVLYLLPEQGSWIAKFFPSNRRDQMTLYIDLAHSIHYDRERRLVQAVDMDLDVVQYSHRQLRLLDRDDFQNHQRSMEYPAALVASVESAADQLLAAIEAEEEPFHSAGILHLENYLNAH